jgi:type II secretory pathway pseudopilin PulG
VTPRNLLRGRAGTTIIEILISIAVLAVILGSAFGFLRGQNAGFAEGTERMDLLQNARYGVDLMARELRSTGSNVPLGQPFLVYGDSLVVAFNADLVSNVRGDVAATYIDPDAPGGAVTSLRRTQKAKLPGTNFSYPDSNYYEVSGVESAAETVVFFFTADSTTSRGDDFVLMRQVNRQAPEIVARNILRTPGQPLFQFVQPGPAGNGRIQAIPSSQLPLRHSVAVHKSPADTGAAARIDAVRGVRIRYTATNGQTGVEERRRAINRLVMLPNAGRESLQACGDGPILGASFTATLKLQPDGSRAVELKWGAAVDETAGEEDVVRYVLWRRLTAEPWGDPFLSIPAGQANYTYLDTGLTTGIYDYSLAAQDCSPKLSSRISVGPIVVP